MFKQQKGKNAFLQKKNQQKAKAAQQQKQKAAVYQLQKHIRAHLTRNKMISISKANDCIKLSLLMKVNLHQYTATQIQQFVRQILNESKNTQLYYFKELILRNMMLPNCSRICQVLLNQKNNEQLRDAVMKREEFPKIISRLFEQYKAAELMNHSAPSLLRFGVLNKIQGRILLNAVLFQFRDCPMVLENQVVLSLDSIAYIVQILFERNQPLKDANMANFCKLITYYLNNMASETCSQKTQRIICYLLQEFLVLGVKKHEQVAFTLIKQNQAIIAMIDDEQMMEQIQQKLRQNELMEDFTNQYLSYVRNIVNHEKIVTFFERGHFKYLNSVLLKIVNQLTVLFEDRKLIFIRSIISSDSLLKSLSHSKDPMFRQGLKMRLLPMDDPEFKSFNIFTEQEWILIIKGFVQVAHTKIQKMIQKIENLPKQKLFPFKRRNRDELEFKTVVDSLSNLYKKVYRTGKFNSEFFVDYGLSNQLTNFLFGKGARKIEIFLKNFPYIFSFESRMSKFKEFMKTDKLNYDRSLFLQEQVDEDLIIAVRRGHQFMDAFEACMTRDLRMKYKIIFFNQQGLEQEGVDGGGIIKEFINRVLRSAFSQTYSLFMETPLNEILPNPYSLSVAEYQFVGKLIGKAVYEGINIQQKFAEPFLNLLIGRQNTFEDLQFIDPSIYNSLLSLKNNTDDISELQQTFVIYDSLPNGIKKYINLLCPSKPPNQKQVLVTNQNKMDFIMSYADFKCNKQIQQKTRLFRKGFLKVVKPEWLSMFSNQQLNLIISGANPDFNVDEMRVNTVYKDYHQKDETIVYFWQILRQMNCEQKSQLLLYITSCSRPPTLGFEAMKPKLCISFDNDATHLPTANTCMNVLRLPNYKNKALLKKKLLYAINSKAGFQFA